MKFPKFELLFFGSDLFSVIVLKYLLARKLCPIQVVTKASTLLNQFCNEHKLDLHSWPLSFDNINRSPNIGLVASFGHLIDVHTINRFPYGLFNIHPSLLPQYRGSTPIQAAIRDGVSMTGCTIMRIPPIPKFDIGEIIIQEPLAIKDEEYAIELRERLAGLGATMFEKVLTNYEEHMLEARPQGEPNKSYAKKLRPEDGQINFRTESSEVIERKVRAYTGFIELFSFCLNGLKIRLEDMRSSREVGQYDLNNLSMHRLRSKGLIVDSVPPGTIYFHRVRYVVCIKCSDQKWLAFGRVTPMSKPRMSALDFYNGYLSQLDIRNIKTDF